MGLTQDEQFLMMPCSPGGRPGLVKALQDMRKALAPDEAFLADLTGRALCLLSSMSDDNFEKLDLYAGWEGPNVGKGRILCKHGGGDGGERHEGLG